MTETGQTKQNCGKTDTVVSHLLIFRVVTEQEKNSWKNIISHFRVTI